MSEIVQSDGVGVVIARESAPGVQPTAGWLQLQPNPGGITNYQKQLDTVERDILSPNLTPERGEVVGYDVSPKLVQDLTLDLLDAITEPWFRSATKHNGGTGLAVFKPTAVTSTQFTVAADGALAAGTIVEAQGFANPANNGLHVVGASSTGTAIKVASLVAEASPPANATLRVAGVQLTAGDGQLDSSGNFTTTTLDCTTLGLQVGEDLIVGDPTSGALFGFTNTAYQGKATIAGPITSTKIPLKWRQWTVGTATTDASQTIRLLFTHWNRNVPITDADYLKSPTVCMEISEPGAGTAGATDFTDIGGCGLDSIELDIPLEGKIVATLTFVGMVANEPGPSHATGSDTPLAPLLTSVFTTSAQVQDVRLLRQSDETVLTDEIDDIKLTFKNNIKPRKAIGTDGAKGLTLGKYQPTADLDTYLISNDVTRAASLNTDCVLLLLFKCGDGGFSLSFPMGKLSKPDKSYASATPVMQKVTFTADRDPATGLLYSMTRFAYLP